MRLRVLKLLWHLSTFQFPSSFIGQFSCGNTAATLDLCPDCARNYIEKINK